MLRTAAEERIAEAGPRNFSGKVLIDATNPLDFSGGFPPKLAISGEDSLGERVQRAPPDAKVVKAFNAIGNFVDPRFPEGKPTMLIAGNDEAAKRAVGDVLADLGWSDVVDSVLPLEDHQTHRTGERPKVRNYFRPVSPALPARSSSICRPGEGPDTTPAFARALT